MTKKKEVEVKEATEVTIKADNVTIETERNGDPAGAKAILPEDVLDNAPKTEEVVTGKHVITGEEVKKTVPVKAVEDYKTKDRKEFEVAQNITGSLNGRVFDMKKGDKVHLNEDESTLFASYLVK